jgi:hypothetical protein
MTTPMMVFVTAAVLLLLLPPLSFLSAWVAECWLLLLVLLRCGRVVGEEDGLDFIGTLTGSGRSPCCENWWEKG